MGLNVFVMLFLVVKVIILLSRLYFFFKILLVYVRFSVLFSRSIVEFILLLLVSVSWLKACDIPINIHISLLL